jgi:hypothetical protein
VLENTGGFDRSDSLLIGCSAGGGAVNPGETDLLSLPIATAGRPTQYELFDHTTGEVYDLQSPANGLALSNLTEPVIGGRLDLRLDNIAPSASAVWLMIGFRNRPADLSVLGAPCFLYSDNAVPPVPMVWGGPGVRTATYSIHLPASTAARVPLVLQGAVVNLGVNPLNVETSNAVEGTTGS